MTAQPLERPTVHVGPAEGTDDDASSRGGRRRRTCSIALAVSALAAARQRDAARPGANAMSLYDFKTTTLLGKPADLGAYRGKVTLVVNVASYCGYTPQYKGLERLHRELEGGIRRARLSEQRLRRAGAGQRAEIAEFCRLTYNVTFPMFSKVVTKAGAEQSPVFGFLGTDREPARVELLPSISSARTGRCSPSTRATSRRSRRSCVRRCTRALSAP